MARPSDWFSPARFRRLAGILSSIDGRRGSSGLRCRAAGLAACAVAPLARSRTTWCFSLKLDLIRLRNGAYFRTAGGNKVTKALRTGDKTALALTLIHSGCFYDQARRLIERGTSDAQQRLVVARREAIVCAPQLVSLLEVWSEVEVRPR